MMSETRCDRSSALRHIPGLHSENYAQLSFSEEELIRKGTGLLATMFPPSWRSLDGEAEETPDVEHGFLDASMRSCPVVMIVVYDTRKRAPASVGDFLAS